MRDADEALPSSIARRSRATCRSRRRDGGAALRRIDVAAGRRHRAQEGAGLDAVGHEWCGLAGRAACRRPGCGCGSVPMPSIFAPIETSRSARSGTSGSRAAFSRMVSPSASVAAISRFSVPVTVTMSVMMRAPLSFARLGLDVAVLDRDLGAHRLQALDVLVDRTRADRAAAGQRHRRVAKAGQQRAQHHDRGAHRLDQLVRRVELVDAGVDHARHAAAVFSAPQSPRRPCCGAA